MSTAEDDVLVTEERGSLVVTINRPEAGNSLSLATAESLRRVLAEAEARSSLLNGIVITGAGGKFFCSGGDLKAYRAIRTPEELETTFGAVRNLLLAIERHPLLVLAAVDGFALGGGAELALACDLTFASRTAKIGFPQSMLGIIPGWNGTERLVRKVGAARTLRLLIEATRLSGEEALQFGLVDFVTPEPAAAAAALDYLANLRAAPLAVRAAKEAINASRPALCQDTTAAIFERLWFTEDHREAETAFIEKRAPTFVGR